MKKILFILALILLGSLLFAEPMHDFRLPDINNKEVKLADLLGKGPVLIDFWATWCVPCKKAMPALHKLAEKYDTLTVVAISIDAPKDVPKAKTFLKSGGFKFVALFDSEKNLAKRLNVTSPPRTYIIDSKGEIVYSHEGYEAGTEKEYEAIIREMLNLGEETVVPEAEAKPVEKTEIPVHNPDEHCGGCQ
jgi:cytochrome c biogenesis protein CcmG, thiol:disulfide interchange protein DsbE